MKSKIPESLYRAFRTFFQAFIGVIVAAIAAVYGNVDQIEWQAVIVLAVSTGLSALMNIQKNDQDHPEGE